MGGPPFWENGITGVGARNAVPSKMQSKLLENLTMFNRMKSLLQIYSGFLAPNSNSNADGTANHNTTTTATTGILLLLEYSISILVSSINRMQHMLVGLTHVTHLPLSCRY